MFSKTKNFETGQTMILTVMVLNGVLLSVAIIAALLMSYQVHNAGDFANTNKAIFAADAGTDWWLYNYYKNPDLTAPIFTNGSSFSVTTSSPPPQAKIIGQAGSSKRAFLATIFLSTCHPDLVLVTEKKSDTASGQDRTRYKNAVHDFAAAIMASSSITQIGSISYADNDVFDFSLTSSTSDISTRINSSFNFVFSGNRVTLSDAITAAKNELMPPPVGHGRPGSQGTILIITKQPLNPTYRAKMNNAVNAAQTAKDNLIRVMAVRVDDSGNPYDDDLRNRIVSNSATDFFSANSFSSTTPNGLMRVLKEQVVPSVFGPCFTP